MRGSYSRETLLSALGTGLSLPFFIVYLHRVRGFDFGLSGAIVATIAVAAYAGNPISGVLVDRLGARRTVLIGLLVAAAGTAAIAFVTEPWHGFAAAATSGFGVAVMFPAFDSLLAVTTEPAQRSSAFAIRHATMNVGFGVGSLVAAGIVSFNSTASFQVLYLVDGASFLAFVPLLISLRGIGDRLEPQADDEPAGYKRVLADRAFLGVVALTALLVTVGYAQLSSAFPAFATRSGGISPGALAITAAVNSLAVALFTLPVLHFAQGRRRRTAALMLVFALWAATWAVTLAAGELGSGLAALAVFALASAIFALGETLVSPSQWPLVNDLAPDRLRGRYNAVNTLALTTGFMLGPLIAGTALGSGQSTPLFLGLIAACGLGVLAAYRLRARLPAGVDLIGGKKETGGER